jgi:hypothetical protein
LPGRGFLAFELATDGLTHEGCARRTLAQSVERLEHEHLVGLEQVELLGQIEQLRLCLTTLCSALALDFVRALSATPPVGRSRARHARGTGRALARAGVPPGCCDIAVRRRTPALLNAMSSRPKLATVCATRTATFSSSDTSLVTPSAVWPAVVRPSVAAQSAFSLMRYHRGIRIAPAGR